MKNFKQNKAITLIALIITIIVLLILAGITISLTIGQSGILNQAQNAGIENEKAQLKEELELAILDIQSEKRSKGQSMKREYLTELDKIGAIVESTGIPAEGQYKDYGFEIDEEYRVTILDKVAGVKPSAEAVVTTQGIVALGETVEIKVTASISEGNITDIVATNGATLKNDTSATEKVFTVSANGTYTFKVTADNGRSATASVEVNTIIEKPVIEIKDIKQTQFTIAVTNNYKEGLITQYKYYVGGTLKSEANTNTKEYIVTGLKEETAYSNIYVEAYVGETKLTSEVTSTETVGEILEVVWTNNTTANRTIDGNEATYTNPTIPVGFSAVNTENAKWNLENGTLSDWDKGLVIKNATDGNEFVWIPCTIDGADGTIQYNRYFSTSGYSETMPSDEKTSVETYKGFYMGRYESGKSDGKIVVQRNKQVWNHITRDNAKTESEKLYNKTEGDSANTKLCSSYAWDTALKFIETKYSTYLSNSTQGNYSGGLKKTGKTTAVNNIYDMGGNVWEFTTEKYSDASHPCTLRGGCYENSSTWYPATERGFNGKNTTYAYYGFRTTLFM